MKWRCIASVVPWRFISINQANAYSLVWREANHFCAEKPFAHFQGVAGWKHDHRGRVVWRTQSSFLPPLSSPRCCLCQSADCHLKCLYRTKDLSPSFLARSIGRLTCVTTDDILAFRPVCSLPVLPVFSFFFFFLRKWKVRNKVSRWDLFLKNAIRWLWWKNAECV